MRDLIPATVTPAPVGWARRDRSHRERCERLMRHRLGWRLIGAVLGSAWLAAGVAAVDWEKADEEQAKAEANYVEERAKAEAKAIEEHERARAKWIEERAKGQPKWIEEREKARAKAIEERGKAEAKWIEEEGNARAKAIEEGY